ncbi:MAG: glycosyltransferase family 4 protein [Chloroflexota bacterium]
MNLAIVSCVYDPEPVVSAQTSAQLARSFASNGRRVLVIAPFPNRPGGKLFAGYKRALFARENPQPNLTVLRCFSFFSRRSTLPSRLLENVSFGLASALALLLAPRPDMVYVNAWPLFAQALVALACKLRRVPYALRVQDVYPESLAAQDRAGSRWMGWLRALDRLVAKHGAALLPISERFARIYVEDRGVAPDRIHVVPNWADEPRLARTPDGRVRFRHSIPPDAFVVVYGGNVGVAAGLENAIEAFHLMTRDPRVYFLIAGDGSRWEACRDLARASGNPRVLFHHPWPADETYAVLEAADLCLLPTRGEQSLASLPSKLIGYFWAARPVLAVAHPESDAARIVVESGAGWVTAGDASALADQIRALAALPNAELRRRGEAGRAYARKHFSPSNNLSRLESILLAPAGAAP